MELRWLALVGCLCALVALGHSAAVPTTDTLVVSRSDEEVSSPSPLVTDDEPSTAAENDLTTEGPTPPVKLLEMTVRSEVSLRYAHTVVTTKVRNPAKKAQQSTFRVLLPETAFISGFVMILNGKSYKAYVKEKEEAKQIYSDAVNAGIGAAHIAAKARDSNHFTVSVNIEPNTIALFNLTYEELLVRRNKVYNHAINLHPGALVPILTVTVHIKEAQKITDLRVPEIRTGNEVDAAEDDPQNSKAVIKRGHDDREATITFSPDLDEQRRLIGIYNDKAKESQSHSHGYSQNPEGVLGQFVVQYDVDRPKEGEILVNDGYFVHFFAPAELPPLNKHVVFVLDTSGSMMDRKMTQLKEAMQSILGELNPGDYFSIVEFASSVMVHELSEAEREPPKPQYYYQWDVKPATLLPPSAATPENIARAKVIVSRLEASGGTNIASALDVAVELINKGVDWKPEPETPSTNDAPHAEALTETDDPTTTPKAPAVTEKNKDESKKLEPVIIFLTDGDPTVGETDPVRIVNRIVEKNYGENRAAIFSLAFGEDADRSFLRKLSLRNEGFMRHIYEAADAALQLRDFYRQVSSPLLADVHFNYPKDQIKEGSLTKHKFRAYYGGSETVVAGRVADGATELAPSVVAVCGVDDHYKRKKFEIFPKVPVARPEGHYLPLERLWAYLTIKQLLDEKDAATEPADKQKEHTPEKKALQIALKYEFVTPLTSLVVVKPNATSAVDAESVDKQGSTIGMPLAAHGLAGLPGPPPPGLAYKAAFSSAIGHVLDHPLSSTLPVHPGAAPAIAYDSSEHLGDYEGGSGRRGRLRSRPAQPQQFTAPPVEYELGGTGRRRARPTTKSRPLTRSRLAQQQFLPASEYDLDPKKNLKERLHYILAGQREFQLSQDRERIVNSTTETTSVSRSASAFVSRPMLYRSSLRFNTWSTFNADFIDEADLLAAVPSLSPVFSTPVLPTQSPLEPLHLEEYSWVREALKSDSDKLVFDIARNGSLEHIELELTRDVAAPKDESDAECPVSGACVYLTRCDDAKTITLDQYKQRYCVISNKYAGVCCPKAKVDVDAPKPKA